VQPFWSVAVTVIGNKPACVVVPDSTPDEVSIVMPVGSVPVTDQVIVPTPPVCVNRLTEGSARGAGALPGLVTVMVGQVM